ncbi:hypothetical protein T492DRAFT_854372 [Pavlovales sp. CCMP2436]|nr:hypothetical protein T492DRAFT_854372 [Pavlovales sp. CCMP2436]
MCKGIAAPVAVCVTVCVGVGVSVSRRHNGSAHRACTRRLNHATRSDDGARSKQRGFDRQERWRLADEREHGATSAALRVEEDQRALPDLAQAPDAQPQLENELLQEREEHRRRPCAYRSRTAATQNFTQLVGAPWRGGAGTLEAVQALAENISASFSEPSSVSSEHSPAGSGELPCSAQLARVHAVVRGPIGDEDGNVRALVLTLSELLDHGLIAFATAQRLALPAQVI